MKATMHFPFSFAHRGWAFLAVGALAVAGVACGDDDDSDADQAAEVEEVTRQTMESGGENAEYVFAHVTDNLIETLFFSTRDECEANPVECLGEPAAVQSLSATTVDGDLATTVAVADFGTFEVALVREDDTWKIDALRAASDEVPEGAAIVDLALGEFSFGFDASAIPADGNFAFRAKNGGAQVHEVVVVEVPEGQELEQALEPIFAEEVPPLALKVFIHPGQTVDVAFEEPLAAGNYALVCFFPDTSDPEFTAHLEKGMVAEFAVQ